MGGCPEDSPECLCIGGGGDTQAKAPDAAMASLGECASGVGLTVRPFVAVVVGESVGQDHQQTPAGSPLPLQGRRAVTDGCSESSESSGTQSAQAALRQSRETVVESLHREDVHGGAPLRAKSVKGHPIPHLVQRCREIGRSGQLVVVDDAAGRARLAGGTGDVQENEHGEVPPAPLALYVDGVIWERAGPDLDVGVDCGVEIEILSLRLATVSLELRPEAGQRPSQGPRVP